MFQIIDTQNNHLPVKSGFHTASQAYKWAKRNLPKESCSPWGRWNWNKERYFIRMYNL